MSINYSVQYTTEAGIGATAFGPGSELRAMRRWIPPEGFPHTLHIVEVTATEDSYHRRPLYRWSRCDRRWRWVGL